jgi:hypothetical protein
MTSFIFGRREPSNLKGLTQLMIILKYKAIRFIRSGYKYLTQLFDILAHLRTRMVYRGLISIKNLDKAGNLLADPAAAVATAKAKADAMQKLQKKGTKIAGGRIIDVEDEVYLGDGSQGLPEDTEKFMYTVLGALGPDSGVNMDSGIGINFKSSVVPDWDLLSSRMGVSREAGTLLNVEFLLRTQPNDATFEQREEWKRQVENALDYIRSAVRLHFEHEMKRNSMFFKEFSIQASTSESDGAPVVRFCIMFRRLTSIDTIFSNVYIPYAMTDIFPDLNFELKSTATVFDMTSSTHASLDHLISARLTGKIIYRRNILMKLLKRTWLAMSAALPKRFADQTMDSKNVKTGVKETKVDKKNSDTDSHSKSMGSVSSSLAKEIADEAAQAEEEMLKRDRERWASYQTIFPTIMEWCKKLYNTIADVTTLNLDFSIKSMSELLDKLSYLSRFHRIFLSSKIAKDPGYIKGAYDKLSKLFFAEMSAIHNRLKAYLDGKLQEEEAKRKKHLMELATDFTGTATSQHNKTNETLQRLASMGIEATADDLIDEDVNDAKNYIKRETNTDFANEINAYIAFELGSKIVSGIHCIELISGVNKYSFTFQGVDIFELIPRFPPLEYLKKQYDESKAKTFALRNKKV